MAHADQDRRKTRRMPFQTEIIFSDGSRFFSEHTINISMYGLLTETSRNCEPGTEVVLNLPFVPLRKAKGVVRWCKKRGLVYHTGIQFVDMTPEQESSIRECISKLFWDNIVL